MQHDYWVHATSYRVASILQQLLRLPNGTSHGRAWHGEEIGFIVAYAEGLRAGVHLQSKGERQREGCQQRQEPSVHPCRRGSLENSTSLTHVPTHRSRRAPVSHWRFWPEQRQLFSETFAPFEVLYLFIEGKGGHCAVQVEHVLAQECPHAQCQALHVFCHRPHCCDHWKRPEESIHG